MRTRYTSLQDRLLFNSVAVDHGFKIDGQPSDCWEWLGNRDKKGYGRICMRHKTGGHPTGVRAHRASYEFFLGLKLREGMSLDHMCRVRACIHPNHLQEVSLADNTRLMRHYWAKRSAEEAGQETFGSVDDDQFAEVAA